MSKADKVKEQIGWMKFWIGVAVAVIMGLCGWLAQNYRAADEILVLGVLVAAMATAVFVTIINRKAIKKINELEEL